jgi:hypothetical protein
MKKSKNSLQNYKKKAKTENQNPHQQQQQFLLLTKIKKTHQRKNQNGS